MIPVFIDLETYYSPTHSLTKMSPLAYCMHPETEVISIAIKVGKFPTDVIFGEENIKHALSRLDWSNKIVVGHNLSGFDGMILAWRLGVRPKAWGCTLAMARPFFAKTVGVSLKKVAEALELGAKLDFEAVNAKGKHLCDFTPDELRKMEDYNRQDTELCAGIFAKLAPKLGVKELHLIDMTIRMLLEPAFVLDYDMLEDALVAEKRRKFEALMRIKGMLGAEDEEAARAMLASTPKFKAFLESQGVPVPMKISKTTEKPTPALAKTDEDFLTLLEHDNELVAAAAEARLGVKSTILETRIEAFMAAADAVDGLLPVPLHWAGADTTWRWSGWAYNPQNLPRIDPSKPKPGDALRKSMRAPKGYKVIVADLSGIELRVNHFLWQVPSSMALFRADPEKADLYKDFAARQLYMVALDAVTKAQRQVGKVAHLGLGFGSGAATFVKVAKLMGGVDMTLDESKTVVYKWRQAYKEIAAGWRTCHEALDAIHDGVERAIDPWELCLTCKEGIILNTGHNHIIRYPGLHVEPGDDNRPEWWYGQGRKRARIYAGKVDENCLGAETNVLTEYGWKAVVDVLVSDRVWDGESWVSHDGLTYRGVRSVIDFGGVKITPDHEVLVDGKWVPAEETDYQEATSSCRRHYGVSNWDAGSHPVCRERRSQQRMGGSLRLWGRKADTGERGERDKENYPAVQGAERLARGKNVHARGVHKQSCPVYDLVNAGPNHRFMVRGEDGQAFIVHNCVQALARDVIADAALEFKKRTSLLPKLSVHDELVYIVPEREAESMLAELQGIMRTPPAWWPELVTWSEGDIADTYGDAK